MQNVIMHGLHSSDTVCDIAHARCNPVESTKWFEVFNSTDVFATFEGWFYEVSQLLHILTTKMVIVMLIFG